MNLMSLTAVELGKKIKSGEVRVVDAVNAAFDQIEAVEKDINSYVTVYKKEEVLEKAEHIQKLIDEGQLTGPLAGVPVAIKDNMCTRDKLTTCSSKILGNFYPTYSAEAVINLEKAGAVIIGKTNMDEFAMGSTTETSSMDQLRIHGIKNMYLVAHQVVAVQQLQQKNAHMHWVQIQVDQLDSQVHFVV